MNRPWSRAHVAVIPVRGAIGMAVRAEQYVPLLDSLRRRADVAAAVLDIESPGGTVTGSDYIYGAAARLGEVKPLHAFSAEICASGGYLIAAAARRLTVQPAAVVGSIGVISYRPLAEDLMRRVGLAMNVSKSGDLKDAGAFWREPTDRERAKEQALVDEYFELFLERIRRRRSIADGRLRELATGEVFTGRQAVRLGLADALGTLDDVIAAGARAAGIARRERWYGPRRTLRQMLIGGMAVALADAAIERVAALATDPRPR